MLIQEEYAQRHSLSMTLMNHTLNNGVALLRAVKPSRVTRNFTHLIMDIRWIPQGHHPGNYQYVLHTPMHNSYGNRVQFSLVQEPQTLSYEEFEECMRGIRKRTLPNFRAIIDAKLATLFAWEMFICCYDGWIVSSRNAILIDSIEASIDPALSIEVRYQCHEIAISMIRLENSSVYDGWQRNFASHNKRVLPWLGKLFNGD